MENIYDILERLNKVSQPLNEGQDRSWVKDPQDPESKIPAYQRKAKDAGREKADKRTDDMNKAAGAKVFRNRQSGMNESDMDESALQAYLGKKKYGEAGMKALQQAGRDGASKEKMAKIRAKHDKMDEADMEEGNFFTGNLAKARAAGKKQADLDGDGDIERVREAAKPDYLDFDKDGDKKEPMKKALKDKKTEQLDELDINLIKAAQKHAKENPRPKDAESERNKHKKYGYRSDRDDTGNEDDYDEWGNEKKKKAQPAAGEKRGRGRPKGSKRSIGARGPSGKSKLLTKEGMDDSVGEILSKYRKDVQAFKMGQDLSWDLYDALYDHYLSSGEMPYGVAKAREGDPYEWISFKLDSMLDDLNEGSDDIEDQGEYDQEGDMAKDQLHTLTQAAEELASILDDDQDLPEWVQSKITKALDYINASNDYMDQERHDNDQFKISESDPNNPDTWSGPSMDKPFPGKSVWPKGKRPGKYNTQTGKVSHWDDRIPSERERDWDSMIEGDLEEKAVSKKQQRFMGMVHAAQKGEKPASKAVAKVAKSMGKKDAKDFAATKHKGLPEKVKSDKKKSEEVEETTTSGAVATSTDAPKGGKKGGMQFGKGVYEAYNQRLEDTINESMDINVSTSSEGRKSISVTATDEDAMALAKLLTLSGLTGHMSSDSEEVCPGCGSADCGCEQMDEDYSNSPEQEYRGTEYMTKTIAGGLNGPHMQVNPNNMGDNPLAMDKLAHKQAAQVNLGPIGDMNESKKIESNLWNLYSEVKQK